MIVLGESKNIIENDIYSAILKLTIGKGDNIISLEGNELSYFAIHCDYINNILPLILVKLVVRPSTYVKIMKIYTDNDVIEDINLNIFSTPAVNASESYNPDAPNQMVEPTYINTRGYTDMIGYIDKKEYISNEDMDRLGMGIDSNQDEESDGMKDSMQLMLVLLNPVDVTCGNKGITNGRYKGADLNTVVYKAFLDTHRDVDLIAEPLHNNKEYEYISIPKVNFDGVLKYLDKKKMGLYKYPYLTFTLSNIKYLLPMYGALNTGGVDNSHNGRKGFIPKFDIEVGSISEKTLTELITKENSRELSLQLGREAISESIRYTNIRSLPIHTDDIKSLKLSESDTKYIISHFDTYNDSKKNYKDLQLRDSKPLTISLRTINPIYFMYPDSVITLHDKLLGGTYRVAGYSEIISRSSCVKKVRLIK